MRSDYEQRKEARIERYRDRAEKAAKESDSSYTQARTMMSVIPMGQPILVGHHSEKGHRAYLKKIDNKMRKSVDLAKKAEHYKYKAAAAAGNDAISSDDPEAITKLKEKIADAERSQELMKSANKIIKSKKGTQDEKIQQLVALGISEANARKLFQPDFCGRTGFAGFELQNNNANIRRMKQRLEDLERTAAATRKEVEINGVKIVDNPEENRVQLFFAGKPADEIRAFLKSHGFRWAPSVGAWQRHRSNGAMYDARKAVELVAPKQEQPARQMNLF